MAHKLSSEEIKILKIVSNGSDLRFKQLLNDNPQRIERIIKSYYHRLPVINDLNKHGINVKDLSELHPSSASHDRSIDAVPILVSWLKKRELSKDTKSIIISILIENPISKKYAFDTILDIFKTVDPNEKDEYGFLSILPIEVGNALLRWVDDAHADVIFNFLKDKKLKDDVFLIASLANFKDPINIQKVKDFVLQELKSSPNKELLGGIFVVLKKLKIIEAEKLVEAYTKSKDTDIRNEAKKTLQVFQKVHNSKN